MFQLFNLNGFQIPKASKGIPKSNDKQVNMCQSNATRERDISDALLSNIQTFNFINKI